MSGEVNQSDIDDILIEVNAKEVARIGINAIKLRPAAFIGLQFAILVYVSCFAKFAYQLRRRGHTDTRKLGQIVDRCISVLYEIVNDA